MLSAAGKPNIVVGSPPEFKGEPDIWAPDELLIGSLNTCMMLTFLAFAQAQGLTPVGYESEAELEPARTWKAPKSTASSQIPLTPRSRSPRSLSLLPESERYLNKTTLNRLKTI
jgi:organic hydroperoxide reductase OsmC/OhrA